MAEVDLYDDAILGNSQALEPTDFNNGTRSQDSQHENDTCMELYDDVHLVSQDLSPPRCRRQHSSHRSRMERYTNLSKSDESMGTYFSNSNKDNCYHLYVGNLTWWTSEKDITNAVKLLGVPDFMEVKFFENSVNGQSKGFCTVTVGSEDSMRIVMDRLPEVDLHGRSPMVVYPTKNNLIQFEAMNPSRSRVRRFCR